MAATTGRHAATLRDVGTGSFRPVAQPEQPPFDFQADLVLVAALVPAAPIRAAFPAIALLSAGGRAPLVAWFSRVHESCYRDAAGNVRCTREEGEGAYAELTLMLPLRNGSFFVPHIEASSALSQRLAHAYYGMPKALVPATFGDHGSRLLARIEQSSLDGRRVGGRTLLTAVARSAAAVGELAGVLPERWQGAGAAPQGRARRGRPDPPCAPGAAPALAARSRPAARSRCAA
jgi:hypothetical protein